MDRTDWQSKIEELRYRGQWFELCDLASSALESFPDDPEFICARTFALVNSGALQKALVTISPALEGVSSKAKPKLRAPDWLREDLIGLGGRIHKEIWRRTGTEKHLALAKKFYQIGFAETEGIFTGINAASTAWLLGERSEALDLAHRVLGRVKEMKREEYNYWTAATEGEALLLLGDAEKAADAYALAKQLSRTNEHIVSSIRQLALLSEHGFPVPQEIVRLLALAPVVIYSGHMVDRAGLGGIRFPPSAVKTVRQEIENVLKRTPVTAGFGSAACGSDLLFIEALNDINAEINVVLPFAAKDFMETSVRFAGEDWEERSTNAIKTADTVPYLTRERYLDDDRMFSHCNDLIVGKALVRARQLMTHVHIIVVVDKEASKGHGGTAEFMERLRGVGQVTEINLQEIRGKSVGSASGAPHDDPPQSAEGNAPLAERREMAAMLFSDIKGFSRLTDENYWQFSEFQSCIAEELRSVDGAPGFVRTVGDAIFAVSSEAWALAGYAIALKHAVRKFRTIFQEFDPPLDVRIALHAAPIFSFHDPIADRPDWFGSHVNRTARLEPVTLPGHIYATEHFVAMLATEEHRTALRGEGEPALWTWELVGMIELAKDFGRQRVFHITETEAAGVTI